MASPQTDKPVFLVVTGAWHPPQCYEHLKTELTALGYECVIPQMPSMGHGKIGLTWEAEKAKTVETATPFFEEGKDIVLIGHSYGGVPATVATEGQGVRERAERGLKGGFRSIIFVAGFAVPVKGWDLLTTFGAAWPDWQTTGESYIHQAAFLVQNQQSQVNEKGLELLYNDCSEEEARKAYAQLLPHSQDAFETGIDFIAADITTPKTYLICESDLVFPLTLQEQLVKSTPGMR